MSVRKLLYSIMSIGIALTMASVSTYANERQAVVEKGSGEIPQELIVGKEVWEHEYTMNYSVYTYPIAVGTSPEEQIGFIQLNENGYTKGLVVLTGDMLEDFDSSTIGEKTFILRNGGWDKEVNVNVVEHVDMGKLGKPASIQASIEGVSGNKMGIETPIEYGKIDVLDDLGNVIYSVALKEEDIPAYDNTQIGTKSFPISYHGFTTTLEIEFHKYQYYEIYKPSGINAGDEFIVPIGTDLNKIAISAKTYAIDENGNMIPTGMGGGIGLAPELINQIDTSKAGVYDVQVKSISDVDHKEYTVKAKVIVGMPKQSTIEELLPIEAQNTLPNNHIVGVWNVPSKEAGAGRWNFQTGLEKGSMVDVWSYHNTAWLSIGTYTVNEDGEVSVSFTADQLSPILLTKSDKKSTSGNPEGYTQTTTSGSDKKEIIKNTSAHTSNEQNILFLISIAVVFASAIVWEKKSKA